MISGQLVLVDKGIIMPNDPRRVLMVYGLIGVPEDIAKKFASDDHMNTVFGATYSNHLSIQLNLANRVPFPEGYGTGHSVDQLLTSAIWRI